MKQTIKKSLAIIFAALITSATAAMLTGCGGENKESNSAATTVAATTVAKTRNLPRATALITAVHSPMTAILTSRQLLPMLSNRQAPARPLSAPQRAMPPTA